MSSPATSGPAITAEYEYTHRLLDCMQVRCELLEALRALAEAQAVAASQAEIDVTLGLLGRKQALLEDLAAVQDKMRPYFSDDPEQRVWKSLDHRQRCRQLSEKGQRLLQETLQLERDALQEMTSRRDAVATQLQDGRDSILANSAYMADRFLEEGGLDIGNL